MKKYIIKFTLFIFCLFLTISMFSQVWTQKTNLGGAGRYGAVSFSIQSINKGYIFGGSNTSGLCNDLWEWDQATDTWTQRANQAGKYTGVAFSIGTKGYVGTGANSSVSYTNDFYEWNQPTNTWSVKASFPGSARNGATAFSIGNKGYVGLGYNGGSYVKDFWEYDQATNTWVAKANFGGTARVNPVGFSIGNKGYIGMGSDVGGRKNDFWEWDQLTDTWIQKANFGGLAKNSAIGFSIGSFGYIGTGLAVGGFGTKTKDFWEWDQATDVWTQKADFGGTGRWLAVGFSIGACGYIATGNDVGGVYTKDLWEYCQFILLPIELISFKGEITDNGNLLEWSTASEINNDYFNLERSTDGINFETIAIIDGAGNSSTKLSYDAIDQHPFNGTNYYRLKQTDLNNKYSYSEIIFIKYNQGQNVNIYPNPSNGTNIKLEIVSEREQKAEIDICNVLGQVIYSREFIVESNDVNIYDINILNNGIYLFSITLGNKIYSRMITVK